MTRNFSKHPRHPPPPFPGLKWDSCCTDFSFLCCYIYIVFCLLVVCHGVVSFFNEVECPFGICCFSLGDMYCQIRISCNENGTVNDIIMTVNWQNFYSIRHIFTSWVKINQFRLNRLCYCKCTTFSNNSI